MQQPQKPIAQKLILAGASGLGREIYRYLDASRQLAWFIDDDPTVLKGKHEFPALYGSIADYHPQPFHAVLITIGRPALKRPVIDLLTERKARPHSFIHETAQFYSSLVGLNGYIIGPQTLITTDVVLNNWITIDAYAAIMHDCYIGEGSHIGLRANICGNVHIGKDVFVGAGATILPGLTIGEGAVIGAGAVVTKDVAAGQTVIGNPAVALVKETA